MTFDAHTDRWFDRLATYAERYEAGDTANVTDSLRLLSGKRATRRNAAALIEMIGHVGDADLQAHVQAVVSCGFKHEFRYAFSRTSHQVSAASELFSMVRQALSYAV